MTCDGTPLKGVEDKFIKLAGIKPSSPIMASAWEHSFMVFCRATMIHERD